MIFDMTLQKIRMKTYFTILLAIVLFHQSLVAQQTLKIMTQDGQKFSLYLNGNLINQSPQTSVMVENPGSMKHLVRISFEDKLIPEVQEEIKYQEKHKTELWVLKAKEKKGMVSYKLSMEGSELSDAFVAKRAQQQAMSAQMAGQANVAQKNQLDANVAMQKNTLDALDKTQKNLKGIQEPDQIVIINNPPTVNQPIQSGQVTNTTPCDGSFGVPVRLGYQDRDIKNEFGIDYARQSFNDGSEVLKFQAQHGIIGHYINREGYCYSAMFMPKDEYTADCIAREFNTKYTVVQNNRHWRMYNTNQSAIEIYLEYLDGEPVFKFK